MFLCLNNMSLNQYVFMSFCLKNHVLLSKTSVTKHIVPMYLCLYNMSLNQYVFMSFCLKNHVLLSN